MSAPPRRFEMLALELELPGLSWVETCEWLRGYLRSEVQKRLRAEVAHADTRVSLTCSRCGDHFTLARRVDYGRRRDGRDPVCERCRWPVPEPTAAERAWVETLDPDLRESALSALAAL